MGRPSEYDPEVADRLCKWLAEGRSLNKFCSIEGNPSAPAIRRWREENQEFRSQYAQARIDQYYVYADQIIEIADDGVNDSYVDDKGNIRTDHDVVHRSRLRVEARKWLLSKRLPDEFGDSVSAGAQKPEPKTLVFKRGETRKSKRADKAKAAK